MKASEIEIGHINTPGIAQLKLIFIDERYLDQLYVLHGG